MPVLSKFLYTPSKDALASACAATFDAFLTLAATDPAAHGLTAATTAAFVCPTLKVGRQACVCERGECMPTPTVQEAALLCSQSQHMQSTDLAPRPAPSAARAGPAAGLEWRQPEGVGGAGSSYSAAWLAQPLLPAADLQCARTSCLPPGMHVWPPTCPLPPAPRSLCLEVTVKLGAPADGAAKACGALDQASLLLPDSATAAYTCTAVLPSFFTCVGPCGRAGRAGPCFALQRPPVLYAVPTPCGACPLILEPSNVSCCCRTPCPARRNDTHPAWDGLDLSLNLTDLVRGGGGGPMRLCFCACSSWRQHCACHKSWAQLSPPTCLPTPRPVPASPARSPRGPRSSWTPALARPSAQRWAPPWPPCPPA